MEGVRASRPPLTWSCMMQLDSQRSGTTQAEPAALAPSASMRASQRPAQQQQQQQQPAGHHTPTCPRYPTSWFVRCASCASHISHASPPRPSPPILKEEKKRASLLRGRDAAATLKIACVSRRPALVCWSQIPTSDPPARRAREDMCLFISMNDIARSCVTSR